MIGRRVATIDDIELPGDYCGPVDEVNAAGEKIGEGVWFSPPFADDESLPEWARGLHRVTQPPWRFRECPDGSLEVRESIACGRGSSIGEYWHGYLDEGHVWRTC